MKRSLGAKTLAMPTPVWLVGSYDSEGRPNIATIAWGGICCSQPPMITVSLRAARHSYAAIMARKAFTVSIPGEAQAVSADFAGLVSGGRADKFAATGWTAVRSDVVDAPYVADVPLVIECRLARTVELGTHTQFIGEIADVKADEAVLGPDGSLDIARVSPIVFDPAGGRYFAIGSLVGKAYEIGKAVKFGEP